MLALLLSLFVMAGIHQQPTLPMVFINNNKAAAIQRIEISAGKTTLYGIKATKPEVLATWNQVPANYDNDGARSRYKMIVESKDANVTRVYEISYVVNHQTQVATAYIKSTFLYQDSRGRKTAEDYFRQKK